MKFFIIFSSVKRLYGVIYSEANLTVVHLNTKFPHRNKTSTWNTFCLLLYNNFTLKGVHWLVPFPNTNSLWNNIKQCLSVFWEQHRATSQVAHLKFVFSLNPDLDLILCIWQYLQSFCFLLIPIIGIRGCLDRSPRGRGIPPYQ